MVVNLEAVDGPGRLEIALELAVIIALLYFGYSNIFMVFDLITAIIMDSLKRTFRK